MTDPIITVAALGFPWQTLDPFLFCVHHNDAYPAGGENMGPDPKLLVGRRIGEDFANKDGWNMYHGDVVPGFPSHPHRGFETVTIARRGYVDHSDSLGAAARFGQGDVQWMTAGSGVVHSEMIPLLNRDKPNPAEFFQIWLNLPRADKQAPPHFSMFWSHLVPRHFVKDEAGRSTEVTVVAGRLGDKVPPTPPPHSWATRTDTDVAIWTINMEPHAQWTLPAAASSPVHRVLYLFRGGATQVASQTLSPNVGIHLRGDADVKLIAGAEGAEFLMLQGRPIGEPVAQHGPFVMNTQVEIQQAFADYRRTQFGGWPWENNAPVHPRSEGRFARHADGSVERI